MGHHDMICFLENGLMGFYLPVMGLSWIFCFASSPLEVTMAQTQVSLSSNPIRQELNLTQ